METRYQLKMMLFLQYFIWGSWLITLGSYMMNTLHFTGAEVGLVYSTKGIASVIMPSLIGIVADKWVRANWLYSMCHLISAGALFYAATVRDSNTMFWVVLVIAMTYMPTIALSNTIAYYCLEKNGKDTVNDFPKIRVFGTVGFIVAMWTISLFQLETNSSQLYIASGASVFLAFYSLRLPSIPSANKKKNQRWITMVGLDAFALFKKKQMAIFFLFATLLGVVLQVTNTFGNPFLHDFSRNSAYADSFVVKYPSILLSISQITEILCILTIPFFLKKFGIKKVMLMAMLAWSLRFAFFAFGNPLSFGLVLLILSMVVYGCAFDFFNISGSIYIEQEVDTDIRASAQGLFMTMVNGIGAYIGSILSGKVVDYFTINGMKDWQTIWLIFATYSIVLSIAFCLSFAYKVEAENGKKCF